MDITIEAVRAGLAIANTRMQVASHNIAHAGVPGAIMERTNFTQALSMLEEAAQSPNSASMRQLAAITSDTLQANVEQFDPAGGDAVALDDQVAELNIDSVGFKALSEGLTRRFALMQLAIAGK